MKDWSVRFVCYAQVLHVSLSHRCEVVSVLPFDAERSSQSCHVISAALAAMCAANTEQTR